MGPLSNGATSFPFLIRKPHHLPVLADNAAPLLALSALGAPPTHTVHQQDDQQDEQDDPSETSDTSDTHINIKDINTYTEAKYIVNNDENHIQTIIINEDAESPDGDLNTIDENTSMDTDTVYHDTITAHQQPGAEFELQLSDFELGAPNITTEAPSIAPTHSYGLCANRTRDYSHRYGSQHLHTSIPSLINQPACMHKEISGFIFNQMTATAGIKKHGDKAVDALFKEFCQLHEKNIFEPVKSNSLSHTQRREALRAIKLIKEKRCGKLKGRTCAEGSTQRDKYPKELTTSPTVSTDALMPMLLIDAYE
jgi:hypothetical protein